VIDALAGADRGVGASGRDGLVELVDAPGSDGPAGSGQASQATKVQTVAEPAGWSTGHEGRGLQRVRCRIRSRWNTRRAAVDSRPHSGCPGPGCTLDLIRHRHPLANRDLHDRVDHPAGSATVWTFVAWLALARAAGPSEPAGIEEFDESIPTRRPTPRSAPATRRSPHPAPPPQPATLAAGTSGMTPPRVVITQSTGTNRQVNPACPPRTRHHDLPRALNWIREMTTTPTVH